MNAFVYAIKRTFGKITMDELIARDLEETEMHHLAAIGQAEYQQCMAEYTRKKMVRLQMSLGRHSQMNGSSKPVLAQVFLGEHT